MDGLRVDPRSVLHGVRKNPCSRVDIAQVAHVFHQKARGIPLKLRKAPGERSPVSSSCDDKLIFGNP